MHGASRLLIFALLAAAAACHKPPPQQNTDVAAANVPAAEVETLPADESSGTPSNQLANGNDNPDVNDVTVNSD
jgi:hypothetical protein